MDENFAMGYAMGQDNNKNCGNSGGLFGGMDDKDAVPDKVTAYYEFLVDKDA